MASPLKQEESIKINLADFVSCQCLPAGSGTGGSSAHNNCGGNIDTISITITLQNRGAGGAGGAGSAGPSGVSPVSHPAIEDSRPQDRVQTQEPLVEKQSVPDTYTDYKGLDEETKDADLGSKQGEKEESKEDIFEDAKYVVEEESKGDETAGVPGDKTTDIGGADTEAGLEDESLEPESEPVLEEESVEPAAESAVEDGLLESAPDKETLEPGEEKADEDESMEPSSQPDGEGEMEVGEGETIEEDGETKEEDGDQEKLPSDEDGAEIESVKTKGSKESKEDDGQDETLSAKVTGSQGSMEEEISEEPGAQEEDGMPEELPTEAVRSSKDSIITDGTPRASIDKEPGSDESSNKSIQVAGSQIDDELPDMQDLRLADLEGELPLEEDEYKTPIGSVASVLGKSSTSTSTLPKAKSSSGVPSRRSSTKSAGVVPSKSGSQVASVSFGGSKLESELSGELCDNCECTSSSDLTATSDVSKIKSSGTGRGSPSTGSGRASTSTSSGRGPTTVGDSSVTRTQGAVPPTLSSEAGYGFEAVTEVEEEDEGECKSSGRDGILLRNVGEFILLCLVIRTIRVVGAAFR